MKGFSLATALFVLTALAAETQENKAVISYAEGSGFILVSGGKRESYDIATDNVIGMNISEGDLILTDKNTFLEIMFMQGTQAKIKIAENTTFRVMALDNDGGGVLNVLYGRIRVAVSKLLGDSRLWVTGYDTVAGVRGTDFGFDIFYDQSNEDSERVTTVYTFEGSVGVYRSKKDPGDKIDMLDETAFILDADHMVRTYSNSPDEALVKETIDSEIYTFWDMRKISVSPLRQTWDSSLDKRWMSSGGAALFALGAAMLTAGGIIFNFYQGGVHEGLGLGLMTVGGSAVLTGAGIMLYAPTLPYPP